MREVLARIETEPCMYLSSFSRRTLRCIPPFYFWHTMYAAGQNVASQVVR